MMKKLAMIFAFAAASTFSSAALLAAGKNGETLLTWYGHAAFEIQTPKGKILFIDPWLKNPLDPAAKNGADPVEKISKTDYILLTHGHFDHVGDSVELAKKTGARLVTNFELGSNLAHSLDYPKDQMGFDTLMNIGGEITIANGEVMVAMVPAIHSSGLDTKKGMQYGGTAAGFVIKIKNGPTIYDSGDTAYFSDMAWIGATYHPDVALINIGGHFAMTPGMAVKAAKLVKAKIVIPQHYKTFPILTQDPTPFANGVKRNHQKAIVMNPGETLKFSGNHLEK